MAESTQQALDAVAQIMPLPQGARVTSATIIVDYLSDNGKDCWASAYLGDATDCTRLGLLRLAEDEILTAMRGVDE